MNTIPTITAPDLDTVSASDLSTASGGRSPAAPGIDPSSGPQSPPLILTSEEAHAAKQALDSLLGFKLGDPGRAVSRSVPGQPGKYYVETPRLDGHGTRHTL